MSHITICVASDAGLHKVNISQAKFVQLLSQVDVGLIGLVIVDITKLSIGRKPAQQSGLNVIEKAVRMRYDMQARCIAQNNTHLSGFP